MKNNDGDEIDEIELKKNYKSDPMFRTAMDFFATQDGDYEVITVDQLAEGMAAAGIEVYRHDIIRMFQSLQGGNRGWFMIGRRGKESRFEFYAPSRALAKLASGEDVVPIASFPAPAMIPHKFRLRAELDITIDLPVDLTQKEVGRIAEFLKTLPFDSAELRKAA